VTLAGARTPALARAAVPAQGGTPGRAHAATPSVAEGAILALTLAVVPVPPDGEIPRLERAVSPARAIPAAAPCRAPGLLSDQARTLRRARLARSSAHGRTRGPGPGRIRGPVLARGPSSALVPMHGSGRGPGLTARRPAAVLIPGPAVLIPGPAAGCGPQRTRMRPRRNRPPRCEARGAPRSRAPMTGRVPCAPGRSRPPYGIR
jgi:hypothetical protein